MAKNVRYRAEFAANAVESGRICGYTYIDMCSTRWTCLLAVARLLGLPSGIGRGSRLVPRLKDVTYAEDSLLSRIRERMQLNVRCDNEVEF